MKFRQLITSKKQRNFSSLFLLKLQLVINWNESNYNGDTIQLFHSEGGEGRGKQKARYHRLLCRFPSCTCCTKHTDTGEIERMVSSSGSKRSLSLWCPMIIEARIGSFIKSKRKEFVVLWGYIKWWRTTDNYIRVEDWRGPMIILIWWTMILRKEGFLWVPCSP